MPNESDTAAATGAAQGTPSPEETMNRRIRQGAQRGTIAAWEPAADTGDGEEGEQPEPVAARMRARAQEIDAQLGLGAYQGANERAFWRGYAQAMDDWAEAAETGPSGSAGR